MCEGMLWRFRSRWTRWSPGAFALALLPAISSAQDAEPEIPPGTEIRIAVSLAGRTLWVIAGEDTVRTAPVAVASNSSLEYAGRKWRFTTPRGRHIVKEKREDPRWLPPDWHYAETAKEHGLKLRTLGAAPVRLSDGRFLMVRDSAVGLATDSSGRDLAVLPFDEHIVFDNMLFIPPLTTRNRQLEGALGRFALDLGRGYLLHGTPYPSSIGTASTHGCIRLGDDDIAWLYENVPIGTPVDVK